MNEKFEELKKDIKRYFSLKKELIEFTGVRSKEGEELYEKRSEMKSLQHKLETCEDYS